MHGNKFRKVMFIRRVSKTKRRRHFFLHNYDLNNLILNYRVLRPDLQGELLEGFRVKYDCHLFLLPQIPFFYKTRAHRLRNDNGRRIPLFGSPGGFSWGISILDVAHPCRNILWMLGQDMGISFENSRKRPFRLYFGHFAQNTQRVCRRNPEVEVSQDFRVEVTFPKRLGRVRGTKLLGLLRHRQNKLPTPF